MRPPSVVYFFGVLQELDDLPQLVLGLVHASHVCEAHFHVVVGVDLGAAARERHHAAFGAAHAAEEEAPDGDEQHERDDPAEDLRQPAAHRLAGVLDLVRLEVLDELRVLDARGRELVRALPSLALRLAELAVDGLVAHRRLDHLAAADERLELAVRDLAARPARGTTPGATASSSEQPEHVPDREGRPLTTPRVRRSRRACGLASREWAGGQESPSVRRRGELDLAERDAPAVGVDERPVAFAELAFEHADGQRIEHEALDGALQRPRAVRRIVAFLARAASARPAVSSTWIFRSSSRLSKPRLDVDDGRQVASGSADGRRSSRRSG